MNDHMRVLTIGKLAEAAGTNTPTIRYYEEIGLLPKASRSPSGQRIYTSGDLARLSLIKRCREFGFAIEQVRVLLGLSISPDRDCVEVRDVAKDHLRQVREKLVELKALERNLVEFVGRCDLACAGGPSDTCVIFGDLSAKAVPSGCC